MARRSIAQMTAVLLVASCAAAACSKRGDKQAKAPDPFDTQTKAPVASSSLPPPALRTDGEGFEDVSKLKPAGPASFADGEAAYNAKKYTEASAIFEAYTERKPDNAWGHYMLGLSAWKGGDLEKAEKAFKASLGIDPDHVKSLVNLSRVFIEQKRFDDALDTLMRAGDIAPDSADVQRLLGRAYSAQGKVDEAVEAYREAIDLDDMDAWSMNNLGLLLLDSHRAADAVPLLSKAVALRQDVAAFHNNLGMALEHTGRFVAAASEYKNALTADPGYGKAQLNLARVEAVKPGPEEPFDLDSVAKGPEDSKAWTDEPATDR